VIEDEAAQVSHTERCHPQLLRQRWEEMHMAPEDMLAHWVSISDKHPPLEAVLDECLRRFTWLNMTMTPENGANIHAKPKYGNLIDGHGETLYAALSLTLDRLDYYEKTHRAENPETDQAQGPVDR
jgi:hypothetical protein